MNAEKATQLTVDDRVAFGGGCDGIVICFFIFNYITAVSAYPQILEYNHDGWYTLNGPGVES